MLDSRGLIWRKIKNSNLNKRHGVGWTAAWKWPVLHLSVTGQRPWPLTWPPRLTHLTCCAADAASHSTCQTDMRGWEGGWREVMPALGLQPHHERKGMGAGTRGWEGGGYVKTDTAFWGSCCHACRRTMAEHGTVQYDLSLRNPSLPEASCLLCRAILHPLSLWAIWRCWPVRLLLPGISLKGGGGLYLLPLTACVPQLVRPRPLDFKWAEPKLPAWVVMAKHVDWWGGGGGYGSGGNQWFHPSLKTQVCACMACSGSSHLQVV